MDRWYAMRILTAALNRALEAVRNTELTPLEERRVDAAAGVLVGWATNRIEDPGSALAKLCEALGLRAGSRVFDRLVRLFA